MRKPTITAEEVRLMEEAIAKGEPCPSCGSKWIPADPLSGEMLQHGRKCKYIAATDYYEALHLAVDRVIASMA